MAHILLLTAERGAGKSTALSAALVRLANQGARMGGILAPARYDETGSKCGIDVVDLATREKRTLAVVVTGEAQRTVGQYRFAPDVMDWALDRLLQALDTDLDLIVIDEIGPLELKQRKGFAPALECLADTPSTVVLIVVRIELVQRLANELAHPNIKVIHLTHENRDAIPERLLKEIRRKAGLYAA